MKIIHISDLHLDAVYKQENYKRTLQLFEYIADIGFDHIVITGDITENAEKSAYTLARRIFRRFGLLKAGKLSIIIGNHDIFGGVHLAEDILNFPKKCKTLDYYGKVKEYTAAFSETYESTYMPSEFNSYPFLKELDDVILIGFNSIAKYSVFRNPFASNGRISDTQMNAFEKMIYGRSSSKKIIVMTHHHFRRAPLSEETTSNAVWRKVELQTMKLRDKKSLLKTFKNNNVSLILHGHIHESNEYVRKGIRIMNAGGSILNNEKNMNVNIIEISGNTIKTSIDTIDTNTPLPDIPGISRSLEIDPSLLALSNTISLN